MIFTDSKYAFLVLQAHAAIWKERDHLTTQRSPIKYGDKSLSFWRQSFCLLRFQPPTVKDTKKGAQKWSKETKQPIRQLREQHYRILT